MKLLLLLAIICGACATGQAPETTNRASLKFTVAGKEYVGVAALQRQSSVKIDFSLPDDTIVAMFATPHRDEVYHNPGPKLSLNFVPKLHLENQGSALSILTAITKRGTTHHAIIDWVDNGTLKARVFCNGAPFYDAVGVAICQSRLGFIQEVSFWEDTVFGTPKGCPEPVELSGYRYQFTIGEGFCPYAFIGKSGARMRVTTFGYTTLKEFVLEAK